MPTPVTHVCRLQLLRAPQLLRADGVAHALSARDGALLARLALEGAQPRARLAAWLWPDVDAERARTHLRQRVFRLRQRAGADLVTAGELMSLAPGVVADLARIATLDEDATALPGELLEGLAFEDDELTAWVAAAQARWRAACTDRLTAAATQHETEGRVAAALAFASRLAADEPLAEHTQRRLMRLHLLQGDAAAALAVYDTLRTGLRREWATSPGAETEQLRLLAERGTQLPAAPRLPLLHPPRLVGRDRERAEAEAVWRAARPLLLLGEPGIGKSRFMNDALHGQDHWLRVSGRPGDAGVPYGSLARLVQAALDKTGAAVAQALPLDVRQALEPLAPGLGKGSASGDHRIDPLRLQQALLALLEAAQVQGLALDDLHHADNASVEVVVALAAALQGRCPIMMAARPAELPAAVGRWVGELATLRLEPLGTHDLAVLIDEMALGLDAAAWAPALRRHTRGNPLFVLETLREVVLGGMRLPPVRGELPLPARVGGLIEHRLTRLGERALQLARIAALAGLDFSFERAAVLMACPLIALAEPWRELERAQVVDDGAFVHDLVLETVRRSVPAALARALHRQIAELLAAAPAVPRARLAMHWSQAGEWPRAAEAWAEAASAAYVAARLDESVAAHEEAIGAWQRAGQDEAAHQQSVHQVASLIQVASGEHAMAAARRALGRASTLRQRAEALVMLSHVQVWLMRYDDCLVTTLEAVRLAEQVGDAELQCHAACRLGAVLGHLGRAAEALPVLDAVGQVALEQVAVGLRCQFLGERGNVLMLADDHAEAARSYGQALQEAAAAQEHLLFRQIAFLDAVLQLQCGRVDAAERRLREAVALRDAQGGEGMARNERMLLGVVAASHGRYADAVTLLEEAVEGFRSQGPKARAVMSENHLARLWLDLGQPARARQALHTSTEGEVDFVVCSRLAAQMSVTPCDEVADALRAHLQLPRLRTAQRLLGALALAQYDMTRSPADAAACCQQVWDEAAAKGLDGIAAHAWALLSHLRAQAGDFTGAAAVAHEPAGAWATELCPARAALWRAQALAAAGEAGAAARLSDQALAWLDAADVPAAFENAFRYRLPLRQALSKLSAA